MVANLDTALPVELRLGLLADACNRDVVTARRATLLRLIWQESYLSGAGLIARTESVLGRGGFGSAAASTFRRDIRALKVLLEQAGYSLRFSRQTRRTGYYIVGRPELATDLANTIRAGMRDIDRKQIVLAARLTPADRIRQAGQLSDGLRRMAVRRLLAERPSLSFNEAYREVAHRYDQLDA